MDIGTIILYLVYGYVICLVVGVLTPKSSVGRLANGLKTKADTIADDAASAIEESNAQDKKAKASK